MRFTTKLFIGLISIFAVSGKVQADAPVTQPADSPEVKEVRQQLLEWDKTAADMSLEQMRKTYHTENEREAVYMDWQAHEAWEACKTEKAVRDKWGADADAKYSHPLGISTVEDDQTADIKVDGNHAVVSWSFKGSHPASMIKVDGHWLNDGHAIYEENLKNDPAMESEEHSAAKIFKQAREEIAAGKYDDADSFVADFIKKIGVPPVDN